MEELEVAERKLGEVYHILSNLDSGNSRIKLAASIIAYQVLQLQKKLSELRKRLEVITRGH